jgi:hypothetical protein
MVDITKTVRRSTWHRTSIGRRAMSHEAPFFSIGPSDDDVARRDALRRRTFARMAHVGA